MPIGQAKFGLLGGVDLGKLELIETQTVSSAVTTVDFTSIQESTYNVHLLTLNNVQVSGGPPNDGFRLYESGVLETASVYQYAEAFGNASGSNFNTVRSTTNTKLYFLNGSTTGTHNLNGYFYFYNLGDNTKYSFSTEHDCYSQNNITDHYFHFGSSVLPQASTVDGIQYVQDITNGIIAGTFSLYGIKES